MDFTIQKDIANDSLSQVRGVGSYCQMIVEAISDYGAKYNLHLVDNLAKYLLIPGFKPYEVIKIERQNKNILVIHDVIPFKHPEHFPPGIKGSLICFWNRLMLSKIDLIITDSQVVKQEITEYLKIADKKIKVVYPATKKLFYNSQPVEAHNQIFPTLPKDFVLYIGDITWNKNLPNLGKALKKTKLPLVLVGKALLDQTNLEHPEKQDFVSFLDFINKDQQFIFLGFVADPDLLYLYQQARLVILPSFDEGFGLPWLEAALQKTPVALSDIPIFQEITKNGAIYFNPQDPDNMAEQILMGFKQPKAQNIEEQYLLAKSYSQENFVKQLVEVINSLK